MRTIEQINTKIKNSLTTLLGNNGINCETKGEDMTQAILNVDRVLEQCKVPGKIVIQIDKTKMPDLSADYIQTVNLFLKEDKMTGEEKTRVFINRGILKDEKEPLIAQIISESGKIVSLATGDVIKKIKEAINKILSSLPKEEKKAITELTNKCDTFLITKDHANQYNIIALDENENMVNLSKDEYNFLKNVLKVIVNSKSRVSYDLLKENQVNDYTFKVKSADLFLTYKNAQKNYLENALSLIEKSKKNATPVRLENLRRKENELNSRLDNVVDMIDEINLINTAKEMSIRM